MNKAKTNVKKYYATVGLLEDLSHFFLMLEYIFPDYFTGAQKLYLSTKDKKHEETSTSDRREPRPETVEILNTKLKYDIEFYQFIKQRFYSVLHHIYMNTT